MSEVPTSGGQSEELLNNERSFVETLVQQYQHATILPLRKRTKLPDLVKGHLKSYEEWIVRAHQYYQGLSTSDGNISLTAEWILDNHYILQQAFHLIQEDMPSGYQEQLPRLIDPPYENFPRIFALIRSLLYRRNYLLNLDDIQKSLNEFQEGVPLTFGELWSIPIFIRFGLIEMLARVLFEDIKPDQPVEFHSMPPILPESSMLRAEITQQDATNQAEIVGRIIRSLRVISETNWEEIFESLSLVEKTLRQDPAGIYPKMDFKTRNLYRGEIEKLARLTGEDESQLAISLLNLCNQTKAVVRGNKPENQNPEHIGVFLIGERRKEFEEVVGFRPNLKARILKKAKTWNTPLYLGSTSLIAIGLSLFVLRLTHRFAFFESLGFPQVLLMGIIALCLIPPAFIVANHLINIVVDAFTSSTLLPKLEFKQSIPEEYKTLVVIPGL
ncbi:MAG TPA: hypothetical protein VLR89_10415, partial [Anaerolineaceae bacterium]|nr:hypothetical protein [Anaerolineaceae bacterium]